MRGTGKKSPPGNEYYGNFPGKFSTRPTSYQTKYSGTQMREPERQPESPQIFDQSGVKPSVARDLIIKEIRT